MEEEQRQRALEEHEALMKLYNSGRGPEGQAWEQAATAVRIHRLVGVIWSREEQPLPCRGIVFCHVWLFLYHCITPLSPLLYVPCKKIKAKFFFVNFTVKWIAHTLNNVQFQFFYYYLTQSTVQCTKAVKSTEHSPLQKNIFFFSILAYSFRLSREKWNFNKDERGCCPFYIGYLFFGTYHVYGILLTYNMAPSTASKQLQ